jgi:phospholipase C
VRARALPGRGQLNRHGVELVRLPDTDAFIPPDTDRHPDLRPPVSARQTMPRQEPGVRPARAVPYELAATAAVDLACTSTTPTRASAPSTDLETGNDRMSDPALGG